MIFADKLIQLRKKSGWSQEELAGQLGVSRQSVSKWEGAQSIPDIERLLEISKLFGVSVDYLLRDELEQPQPGPEPDAAQPNAEGAPRRVGLEEATAFMEAKAATAGPISWAVFACILSPICLLTLGALSQPPHALLSEVVALGAGMAALLALVAGACAVFVTCGGRTARFAYLDTEPFETGYGVAGAVNERREQFRPSYVRGNVIGVCLCVTSVMPLFVGLMVDGENALLMMAMLSALLALAGAGAASFVRVGVIWAAFERLLQEGEYTRRRKATQGVRGAVTLAYWLTTTAVYLGVSFLTNAWQLSWLIWAIAGVLYPAVGALCDALLRARGDR